METRTCLGRSSLCVVLLSILLAAACNGQTEPTDTPGASVVIWPQLDSAEPDPAEPGGSVIVVGREGYIITYDGEGHELINESHREFALYFDGAEIGRIACYVNRCEGEVTIPDGVDPGEHEISVEGGSVMRIQIAGD